MKDKNDIFTVRTIFEDSKFWQEIKLWDMSLFWIFHRYLYNKQNITWPPGDTNFIFSCW